MFKNVARNIILLTINQNRPPEHLANNQGFPFLWNILVGPPKENRKNFEAFFIPELKASLNKGGLKLCTEMMRRSCHFSPGKQKVS